MSDRFDRRNFLKMAGAAGFGIGLLSKADLLNGATGKGSRPLQRPERMVQPEGPYSTRQEWSGQDLWNRTVTRNLQFNDGRITLDNHVLVEDDAPGLGSVQSQVWERIESGVVLEKHLMVDRLPPREAFVTMLVYPVQPRGAMSGGQLQITVNGHEPIVYEVNHFWTSVPVPAEQLRIGSNRILVTVHGEAVFRTPVALASNYQYGSVTRTAPSPQRSRRSDNRGSTWTTGLGADGEVQGEYPIRLTLRAYQPEGWLQTPVIDLTDSPGPLYQPATVEQARISLQTARRGDSRTRLYVRSGQTHRPETGGWSSWEPLRNEEVPAAHRKRFLQLKVMFESESGEATARLDRLRVESRVRPEPMEAPREIFWLDGVNRPLVDKPYEFEHEDPMAEELQAYRRRYNLDEVVKDARNETELILKLNNWAASRWDWHMPPADVPDVIQWSGDQIMTPDETGEIGGYCLLFSIVLAQACQSFGIPARIVNLNYAIFGGHEVVEVWSRDYEKWFMADPNFDSIFVSEETGKPMSVLELHEVFLETYYPGGEVVDRDAWSDEERDRRGAMANPDEIPIRFRTDGYALSGKIDNDYIWWRVTEERPAPGYNGGYGMFNTAYVRWIPRSNWLSQPYPTPVTHGRTHWGWDGYLAWTDEQTPRTQEHRHFLRKESDIYDRLCTVDYGAEMGRKGFVQVHLATETPGFSHFELISNDRHPETTRAHSFQWELSTGVNRLQMRSVDVLGNRGPASELIVSYIPA